MATEAELGRKFAALMRQSQYVGARPAITGLPDADNDDIAQVEDNPNKVWIRFLDGDRQLVDVYHMGRVDTGRSNLYVIVEPTISGDSFQVKGYDPTRGDVQDGNNATPPPAPPIINETTVINQGSLRDLQPFVFDPPSSFRLGIRMGYLFNAYFPEDSVYLGDYYPATAGYFNWVKVGIDPTVSPPLIVVGQGDELAPGDPRAVQSAAPEQLSAINLGTNVMPIGGILIKDGQTSIRKRFIVDLRVMTNGPSGSGSVLWERTGNVLHPQDLANLVSIGADDGTGKLSVIGDADIVQVLVKAHSLTPTSDIIQVLRFNDTVLLSVTPTGLTMPGASTITAGGFVGTSTGDFTLLSARRLFVNNNLSGSGVIIGQGAVGQTAALLNLINSSTQSLFAVTASGAFVANEQGLDADSRIEGDNDANLLFIDAGADRIGIGDAVPDARLHIEGRADELQVYVRGHSTQTNNLVLIEANDGTDLLTLDNSGDMVLNGDIDAGNGIFAADVSAASGTFAGAVSITGSADTEQLHIIGNGTQTDPILLIEASGGADLLTLTNNGTVLLGGTSTDVIFAERDAAAVLTLSVASDSVAQVPRFRSIRYGGTQAAKTATPISSQILSLMGIGYDGSALGVAGEIRNRATETWSGTGYGNDWIFITTANGSTAGAVRMTIQNNGGVAIAGNFAINGVAPAAPPTWGVPTGTLSRATFATGSVTLAQLAQRVAQAIIDLQAYGIFV